MVFRAILFQVSRAAEVVALTPCEFVSGFALMRALKKSGGLRRPARQIAPRYRNFKGGRFSFPVPV
jgi:hypothetical protein